MGANDMIINSESKICVLTAYIQDFEHIEVRDDNTYTSIPHLPFILLLFHALSHNSKANALLSPIYVHSMAPHFNAPRDPIPHQTKSKLECSKFKCFFNSSSSHSSPSHFLFSSASSSNFKALVSPITKDPTCWCHRHGWSRSVEIYTPLAIDNRSST